MVMRKIEYNVTNIIVILVALVLIIIKYTDYEDLFSGIDARHIAVVCVTVFLVHFIKAMRLYLVLYGTDIPFKEYLKVYCKVTPVSIIYPLKTGECFRMYCYGNALKNILKGVVTVALDRFMDTIALMTTIILMWVFYGEKITNLVYILILFLAFSLVIYFVFPNIYRFWKLYIIRARATEKKMRALRFLDLVNNIYSEITNVTRGRGVILFFMSLSAWWIEIGSLVLLSDIDRVTNQNQIISDYLMAAIGKDNSIELFRFVFISLIMTIGTYLVLKFTELISKEKE